MIAPTPFFSDRGCHVRILEEAIALKNLGYKVRICTYHLGREIEGIKTHRIIRIPWYSKVSAGPSIHKFLLDFFLLWTVFRVCLEEKPDILHAHLHEGIVIGWIPKLLFNLPLIADLQGSLTGELIQHHFIKEGGLFHRFFQWVESRISQIPDVILISSKQVLKELPENIPHIKEKVAVIPDGVDTRRFIPAPSWDRCADRFGISRDVKIVGFLGVLTDYQGVSILLEAIPPVVEARSLNHLT